MLLKKDIKEYLQISSSSLLNLLKISTKIYALPSIIIYPSSSCNYNCIMCAHAKGKKYNKEVMDFSLMKKIINECSKLWLKQKVHFSGYGEPLVYPEIKETMELCRQKKIKWSITTNGYLLKEFAESIISNNCNSINISIHGDKSENNRITGLEKAFEKTIEGIKKLDEVKKKSGKNKPLVAVNCVFSHDNVQNLKNILDIFVHLPINSITFQHLFFSEDNLKNKEDFLIVKDDELNKLIEFIDMIKNKKLPIKVNFYPKIKRKDIKGYYTDKDYRFGESCIIPWLSARIYPNGDVKLCDWFFGNLKESSLKSVINSKRALKFRNLIKKGEFKMSDCFRCCHRSYYQ